MNIAITSLSHDGRGVGRLPDGKTVFVRDAVPGDQVSVQVLERHPNYDEAQMKTLLSPSDDRAEPFCPHYQSCGGCQLQHLSIQAQRRWKAEHFFAALLKTLKPKQCEFAPPLVGEDRGYRRRVKMIWGKAKTDKLAKMGFRARQSNDMVDVDMCPLMTPSLNQALAEKRQQHLPQASRALKELVLVEADNGVFSSDRVHPEIPFYRLDGLTLEFRTEGFIQVNADINRKMVAQAIDWLELESHHQVLDLFCGVGNFSLPIAKRVKKVVAIEGMPALVAQTIHNAERNQLENVECYQADLFNPVQHFPWFKQQKYDRVLLDPGRMGALEICRQMRHLKAKKLVYVSCNEATLMRDLKALREQGYEVTKAGFVDMFPHTAHAEVMVQLAHTQKPAQKRTPGIFKF